MGSGQDQLSTDSSTTARIHVEASHIMRKLSNIRWATWAQELGWWSACLRVITCLRSRKSSVGNQCPQAARIVNQDVLARWIMRAVPHSLVASPNSSARQPSRYG